MRRINRLVAVPTLVVSGLFLGACETTKFGEEVMKGFAEPFARVGEEFKRGNPLAPLYATRGAVNGLTRWGHALSGENYEPNVGEDGPLAKTCFWEGATAGVAFAPIAPWTFVEGAAGGGAVCAVGEYFVKKK